MCQNCVNQEAQADLRQRVRVGSGSNAEEAFRAQVKQSVEKSLDELGKPVVTEEELRGVIRVSVANVIGNPELGKRALIQSLKGEQAKHGAEEETVFFEGNDRFSIKPFATLDDVVVTGAKVAKLIYPAALGEQAQADKYEIDLARAVGRFATVEQDGKFEALAAVLAQVLIGFDPDDLDDAKAVVKETLEKAGSAEVRKNTIAFLQENGFAKV